MTDKRHGYRASRPLRNVALSACCALGLGCFWSVPVPVGATASARPEVREPVSADAAASRDAVVLARRILQWQGEELFVDERRLDRLTRETGTVLALIRKRYPSMAEIAARQPPAKLLLKIEGTLLEGIAGRWTGLNAGTALNGGVALPTGHATFDALSARLGLQTAEFWPAFSIVFLHFADPVNPRAAAKAFSAITGVVDARLDRNLIDGSDIAMRKIKGTWYVVIRKAWGDCPAGCIHRETHFFAGNNRHVERIDEKVAREMPAFRTVKRFARLGW
ncbi:MAG: hypothetical protein OXE86_11570 [Alphaproteobacteria bacterium]|nr:hypothetical protein [Alphaproteobacteria bacterium]